MKRKFNKNQLVTYVLNEHNKTIKIRYYKSMIVMHFETGIIYKYIFKNNNCLEYKYINGTLIGCTVWENKTRQSLIEDIQDSHAGKPATQQNEQTRKEKQKTFFKAITSFFNSISI